ncbi:MAG: PAS domain S-box protein [Rhodocyclaceae bacterium]|nr:PAS domain S-box protein [Rhodocyclaceae bacterium]
MKGVAELCLADIMSTQVRGVAIDTTIGDAARCMTEARISSLIIRNGERLDGIITERDMVRYLHQRVTPETPVRELMSTPVVTAPALLDIRSAYDLLARHGVRHLVAVSPVGDVLGVASDSDFRTPLGMEVFRSSCDLAAVMDDDPPAFPAEASLHEVIARMHAIPSDYVLCVADGKALGILTERDMPVLLAEHREIEALRLAEVMSSPVECVSSGTTVVEALRRMDQLGFRHMAVADAAGRLVGVVSQHRLLERLGFEIIESAWREREALEAERSSLEGRLAMVLDMTGVGVWEYDFERDQFAWSTSVAAMMKCSVGELPRTATAWIALVEPDDRDRVLDAARLAYRSDAVFESDCRVNCPSETGGCIWVRFRGRVVVRAANGWAVRAAGTVIDITAQRSSEAALESERRRLRTLFNTLPDLVWLKDPEGRYLACNPPFERLYGATEKEIIGRDDFDFVDAEQAQFFRERDRVAIAAGTPVSNKEWVTFASDGRRVLLETIKTVMRDAEGHLVGVLGIGRDITAEQLAQTALAQRVREVATLYEIFRETERTEGTRAAMLRKVVSLLPGGMRYPELALVAAHFAGEEYGAMPAEGTVRIELPFSGGCGRLVVGRRQGADGSAPAFNADERIFLAAIAERVTNALERLEEIASLRDREEVFSAIVGQARDGIVLVDTDTLAFSEFNDAACTGLGYTREEFARLTLPEVQARLTRREVQDSVAQMLLVGGGELKVEHLRKDESVRIARASARVVIVRSRPYLALIWTDITAQERTTTELRVMRERFELAFQASPVAASIARLRDGRFVDVNAKFERDFQWPRDQLIGRDSVELGLWLDESDRQEMLVRLAVDNGVIDYFTRWRDREQRVREVSISARSLEFDGEPHLLAFVVDVTERRAAEAALRDSERRFRALFEEIPQIAVQGYDEARRVVFWNRASESLYGYTEAEALGCLLEELIIPPAIRDDVVALHGEWLRAGTAIPPGELDLQRKDGVLVPVYSSHAMLSRPDGRHEMYCVDVDLTPLREAESRLRESEASYRALVAALAEGVLMLGADSKVLTCNPRAQHILGRGAESLVGERLFDRNWSFLNTDGAPLPLEVTPLSEVLSGGGQIRSFVVGYRHPDGRRRWLEMNAAPLPVRNGERRPDAVVLSFVDITARYDAEEAVRKLSLAVEQSPNAVLITDRRANIEYVNEAFVRITGYARDEVLGRTPGLWRSGETPRATYERMWASLRAGEPWRGEFVNRSRNGERRIDFVHISPVRQSDGRITHFLAIQEDITERKRIGEELDRHRHHLEDMVRERTVELETARDAAEAASRAKSAFLANMSHEIRTPMNAIIGLTHLLEREVDEPRQREHLRKVSGSARHLLGIINDVLDISKIEADKVVLEASNFRLGSVFENVTAMLAERCREKGLDLQVWLDPQLPRILCGDALRLGQVLLNFAGNAVKFTARGSVTIRALLVAEDAAGILLRGEVEDTGVGVDEAAQARLFDAFEQADSSTTRRFGGTGLGLAINKRLIGLMGGEVGFTSAPGKGSRFWFTARFARASGEAAETAPRPGDETATAAVVANMERELVERHAGARILLAEDNPVNREVALSLMADLGFSIDWVDNGRAAVAHAIDCDYDLILMDMQMPEMDGVEATQAIRALPSRQSVPIVALTANAFDDDRRLCLAAGMNGHVAKPVEPATLFAALHRWLPARNGRKPVVTGSTGSVVAGNDDELLIARVRAVPGVDVDAGLQRVRGKSAAYARLLRMFVDGHAADAETLRNLLSGDDRDASQRLAHTVKGAAGMIGAVELQSAAAAVEQALLHEGGDAAELQAAFDRAMQRVVDAVTGPG